MKYNNFNNSDYCIILLLIHYLRGYFFLIILQEFENFKFNFSTDNMEVHRIY